MKQRAFECIQCGKKSNSFLTECRSCGAAEYRRQADDTGTDEQALASSVAKLSRPVNPMAP